jgi:tetratricopeptide (TPR) repeat protein
MILKAYIYEMLDKPYEAKSCLSSPDITEDIKLFSELPAFEADASDKAEILKTLSEFHEEDKIFKEYSAIINKAISEKRNLPKRKKAFELIEIANESFNRNEFEKALAKYNQAVQVDSLVLFEENVQEHLDKCAVEISEMKLKERRNTPKRKKALEIIEIANESFSRKDFISAHIKYNQAVQIDSLVLSDEKVQEYLEKCVNEIPELKLKVRSDAYVILDKGKEFFNQKKFEEALYCFGMIVKSGVYMSTEKFIELWNASGEAYKSLGVMNEAEKSFQTAKELEQKLKDRSEQKGKKRGS